MTETEWLTCDDPQRMLEYLQNFPTGHPSGGRETHPHLPSDRKLRLFACACCRQRGVEIPPTTRASVEMAERFADGAPVEPWQRENYGNWTCTPEGLESMLRFVVGHKGADHALQATLLRDIVGSPWRPVTLPADKSGDQICMTCGRRWGLGASLCCAWGQCDGKLRPACPWLTPQVLSLARAAYDERPGRECEKCRGTGKELSPVYDDGPTGSTAVSVVRYSSIMNTRCPACSGAGRVEDGALDPHRLLVLADALEEAGCPPSHQQHKFSQTNLLDHLRSPGPHVRGCWAVDLILNKE